MAGFAVVGSSVPFLFICSPSHGMYQLFGTKGSESTVTLKIIHHQSVPNPMPMEFMPPDYIPETPVFDLTALGLTTITTQREQPVTSTVDTDTIVAIRNALSKGAVKFKFGWILFR